MSIQVNGQDRKYRGQVSFLYYYELGQVEHGPR